MPRRFKKPIDAFCDQRTFYTDLGPIVENARLTGKPGYLYPGGLFIEMRRDGFAIGHGKRLQVGSLTELEDQLFEQWANRMN